MALTAAEIRAVYSVDERPLDRSLGGLGGKVKGAIGGAVGAAAGLFAFSQISKGFFDLTGNASDLNETINKSSVIFGTNAAQIEQWAGGAAKNLGMSKQQALDAAAGFGDMFSQIGFAGNQAADMSKSVVQMAADLGSFNNLPTEDVAQRISAAFRGEYDSLQALIPNINAARVESEAMAATGKKTAKELTAQEKAAAVLAIVNKDGARAMGDFARTSDGAANAAKIATAEWNDQKAAIGQQLLPALSSMIGFVRTTVIPAVGDLANFIGNDVVPALKDMAEWVQANETPVKIIAALVGGFLVAALAVWAARTVASAATNTVAWFTTAAASSTSAAAQSKSAAQVVAGWLLMGTQALLHGLKVAAVWTAQIVASAVAGAASFGVQVARVVVGWVLMGTQALLQAARMAAAWLIAMGPVGWVIAAVIGLVALIIANWDTVVSWTKTAWSAVTSFIGAAWEWIKGAVSAGIKFLVNLFLNFTGPGLIIKHWNTIVAATQAAWNWVVGLITGAWNAVKGAIAAAVGWVAGAVSGAWNKVKSFTQNAWNGVTSVVSNAWNNIRNAVSNGINGAVDWVRGLPGRALAALGNIGSVLWNAGASLIQGLINGVVSKFNSVKSTLGDLTGKLTSWKGPPSTDRTILRDAGRMVIGGFIGGLESQYGAARRSLEGFTSDLAGMRPAVADEMLRIADTSALNALTVRRPAGVGAANGAGGAAGSGAAAGGAGTTGPLVHIEEYHEQPGSSPAANAAAIGVEVRTRPWT